MVRTLRHPPVGGETPDDLDFLEGIDLHGVHQRERRSHKMMTGVLVALALLAVLGAIVATVLLTGTEPTTDEYPDSGHRPIISQPQQPTAAHDSWAAPAIAAYQARLLNTHDSWATPATTAYFAELDALYDSGHRPLPTGTTTEASLARDSWLPPALAAYEAEIASAHDSWAAPAIAAYHAELDRLYDSGHRPANDRAGPQDRDSWSAPALAEHEATLVTMHDSGIAQAVEAREVWLANAHDSVIELLLAG
jgi:hypothetical protein